MNLKGVWGFLFVVLGMLLYLVGVMMAPLRRLFFADSRWLEELNHSIVWYSGLPVLVGLLTIIYVIFVEVPKRKKLKHSLLDQPVANRDLTVVLTAYNDELSIGLSVKDFLAHERVKRVVVISNNSTDNTMNCAQAAGALVHNERLQGYGACVYKALSEGIKFDDTELTLLCEGDMTFRASDIEKFLAYIDHVDLVCGSRISEQLISLNTQLTIPMFFGNYVVAKLLEFKHLGKVNLSDVGSTYKLCRNSALKKILPMLNPLVNLDFNPYFIDKCLQNDLKIVECPISFYPRVGKSKGGNINNWIAAKLGFRMIRGIVSNWMTT